uniref:Putative RdRp n=1 Tax=Monilinia partitivirus A TaxID=2592712 RepID=A0A7G3KIJ5_9VIRU|nr:putative RdRp [Monilinia partitivirus A]
MNLNYIKTLLGNHSLTRDKGDLSSLAEWRLDYVYRSALKFFSKEEVDQAASNRRSNTSDDAVIDDFMSFEQPVHPIPRDDNYLLALQVVKDTFHPGKLLYPVSFPDLRYYPWNIKPNAEAPWNTETFKFKPTFRNLDDESESPKLREHIEKLSFWISDKHIRVVDYLRLKQRFGITNSSFHSFHNLYNEIFSYNRSLVHFIKDGLTPFWQNGIPIPYYWSTLHARAHVVASDEPDKIRAVFGAPKLLLMVENMFIWPLQATYLNNDDKGRLLWGRETIKGGWKKLYNEINSKILPNTVLSLDWSQFDKRLLFELIDDVHIIWRSYFDFNMYQPTSFYPTASTTLERIERLWTWMCHSIKYTPILLPDGRLYNWTRNGFGSGYQQTQLMDSFANAIMILTCLKAMGINIESKHFWIRVQGDDSLIAFQEMTVQIFGPSALTSLASAAKYYFNAILSEKKSQISDSTENISVLSFFNSYGLPYRKDEDLLRHLMFPETPGTKDQLLAASIGLAYSACGCSPRFHNLCDYIVTRLMSEDRTPDLNALNWMIRAGIFEPEETAAMLQSPLPSCIDLRASVWSHTPRSYLSKERLWPTEPGTRGRFFFL